MNDFDRLIQVVKRKNRFDDNNPWANGSATYLAEIIKEIDEVREELKEDRLCYLEDELGDVLWDYLNLLVNLSKERNVKIESVLKRACHKYEERMAGIENGIPWKTVKEKQKAELEQEHLSVAK